MNRIAIVLILVLIVLFGGILYMASTATTTSSSTATTKTAVFSSTVLNNDVYIQTAGQFQDYLWGSFTIPSDFKTFVSAQIDYTANVASGIYGTYLTLWIQDTTTTGRLAEYYNGSVPAAAGNINGTTGALTTLPTTSTIKANDVCRFGITTYSNPELSAIHVTFTLKYQT